jgi:NADH pyrophosphatase NudC (nudix superfamily)
VCPPSHLWQATSTEIRLDTKELEDAQWFSREEVAGAKELVAVPLPNEATGTQGEGQAHISIPGPYAIAHHLYVQDKGGGRVGKKEQRV